MQKLYRIAQDFLGKSYPSLFILVLALGTLGYHFFGPFFSKYILGSDSEKFSIIGESSIYFGDLPTNDEGTYDFKKIDSSLWLEQDFLPSDSELRNVAESNYLWLRIENNTSKSFEDPHALIEHWGANFQIYDQDGNLLFQYGDMTDESKTPRPIQTEFSWFQIKSQKSQFFYVRMFHRKGSLMGINAITNRIGNKNDIYLQMIENNLFPLVIASFFLLTGVICGSVYFVQIKKQYLILLDFSVFSFLFGIMGLTMNDFIRYISTDKETLFKLTIFLSYVLFIPMYSGLRRIFGEAKWKILSFLFYLNLAFGIFGSLLFFFFNESELGVKVLINLRPLLIFFAILNNIAPMVVSFFAWRKNFKGAMGHFIGFSISFLIVCFQIYKAVREQTGLEGVVYWGILFNVFIQGLELERHLFSNSIKLKEFETNLLRAEKSLKESFLKGLQTKMNPHYLFNSLNTIHALQLTKPELAKDAILSLANNYRFFLEKTDNDLIPLEEEWTFLEDYVHMQRLRFFDSVQIDMHMEKPSFSVLIPPLTLQPILENAFKHGFEGKEDKSFFVSVRGKEISKSTYSISIIDNGKGLPEHLESNEEAILLWSRSLGNIRERLQNRLPGSEIHVMRSYPSGLKISLLLEMEPDFG